MARRRRRARGQRKRGGYSGDKEEKGVAAEARMRQGDGGQEEKGEAATTGRRALPRQGRGRYDGDDKERATGIRRRRVRRRW